MTTDTTRAAAEADPGSRHLPSSAYVDDAYYRWLGEVAGDLARPIIRNATVAADTQAALADLLVTEARLLDQQAYETWLSLFSEHCAYWIPATWPATDPRTAITLEFHDRRRLLDRAARLATGLAYSQAPASRTARQFSGLEIWSDPEVPASWRARCSFTLVESRQGRNRTLAGWQGWVLRREGAGLRIAVKQINLIDCDSPQGNNSFFL